MTDTPAAAELGRMLTAVEPAARLVPPRALRRAIRMSRDRGTFRPRAVHDRCWWVRRDELFQLLTPGELDLSPLEPAEVLLLIPAPGPDDPPIGHATAWRTLFHAVVDRELDAARGDELTVHRVRTAVGPTRWQAIRSVLTELNLVDASDDDHRVFREAIALGLELMRFGPEAWETFFPGLRPDDEPFRTAVQLIDVERLFERTRPPLPAPAPVEPVIPVSAPPPPRPAPPAAAAVAEWAERGNDLKAAILLERAGETAGRDYLRRLSDRAVRGLELTGSHDAGPQAALEPLLAAAARGGWPVERRLLYELQRACLAVERLAYTADLMEWARTLGRRPIKRPLPKTRWLEANRRLRAAHRYAERLPSGHEPLVHLLEHACHATEERARAEVRPELVAVLDEVGLVPQSVPEAHSREKLIEELLDAACARGFLRIGDLRDAVARNRVKLDDLRGVGELVRGDPLIRANEKLPVRLDGVYRRGEVYMRLLQRGCSVFFGTRVGRWLTLNLALPFGGAFVLLEGLSHLYDAAEGLVDWVSGWTATVNGIGLLGGGAASTLADNPTLEPGGVGWPAVLIVGLFLLLMIRWPAFRARVGRAARFAFVKVPRAIRQSEVIRRLVHNPLTRFFRRYLLLPIIAGITAVVATWIAGGDSASIGLVGGGAALLAGTFFRTPLGRELEDRLDEAMERVWRVVSVNFAIGVLTLIVHFFRAVFEAIDRGIHAVDEWLRFREGEGRSSFVFKAAFGAVWFVFTYLFRFAWNLLVEPQINPVKHFPVVTVSHKVLLPLIGPLSRQFGLSKETTTTIVFGIPGIFGFLVWEFRENWKLYRANSPRGIRPIQVGSHGETVRGLLRPGFHSGTVPKAFAKLRRAVRAQDAGRAAKHRHTLDHVAEAVHRFADRTFATYLRASRRWAGPATIGHPVLGPNRIVLPIEIGDGREPVRIALEEQAGWVIGSVDSEGGLADAGPERRAAFADALLGLYKRAGVHVVREQVAVAYGPQAFNFEARPEGLRVPLPDGTQRFFDSEDGPELELPKARLPRSLVLTDTDLAWADWVARWEADAAGKSPRDPLMPGWTVLPPAAG
jgi:hypothetical protein